MSFTETQLIHRMSHSPSTTTAFLISSDVAEDKGLILKIDKTMGDHMGTVTGTKRTPVPSQFCGQTNAFSFSRLAFQTASCVQAAHFSFVAFTTNVNEAIQKKAIKILPLFLYMSLLVLAIQGGAIILLLSQSEMPLGIWFQLGCITSLGGMYCFTTEIVEPYSTKHIVTKPTMH